MTLEDLEKLGAQWLTQQKEEKRKQRGVHLGGISCSNRPWYIKALAATLVGTGEVVKEAGYAAVLTAREIKHQKRIRAGKRMLRELEDQQNEREVASLSFEDQVKQENTKSSGSFEHRSLVRLDSKE